MKNQQAGNERRSLAAAEIWETQRPEIVARYVNGPCSQKELAEFYGVSPAAIQKALKRMGIKTKGRGRSGEANGRYKDGSQSTLYRKVVEKKNCNRCGATENLCVHHQDENRKNNIPANLEVLCMSCHSTHHKQNWWNSQKTGQ